MSTTINELLKKQAEIIKQLPEGIKRNLYCWDDSPLEGSFIENGSILFGRSHFVNEDGGYFVDMGTILHPATLLQFTFHTIYGLEGSQSASSDVITEIEARHRKELGAIFSMFEPVMDEQEKEQE